MSLTSMTRSTNTSEETRELRDFTQSIAIVVSSCDAFFDAWRPFAFFFNKFWPDCPLPVFLITNELKIESRLLRPLAVGRDRGWSDNLAIALGQITADYVVYFQEDYFLTAPVQTAQLAQDISTAIAREADALCFRARSVREADFAPVNDRFGSVPLASDGRTRCQVTLWNRRAFASILRPGEDAWEMERDGSPRTRDLQILSYSRRENTPIPYLMSAIVRGLWTAEALALMKHEGVAVSPHFRSTYSNNSLLRGARRRLTRQRSARSIAAQKSSPIILD